MEPGLWAQFNADFTPEKYTALLRCVNEATIWSADFRISETPIFLTRELTDEAVYAANQIAAQTQTPEFDMHSSNSGVRSEEHTSELQSRGHLVCRLLLEKQ